MAHNSDQEETAPEGLVEVAHAIVEIHVPGIYVSAPSKRVPTRTPSMDSQNSNCGLKVHRTRPARSKSLKAEKRQDKFPNPNRVGEATLISSWMEPTSWIPSPCAQPTLGKLSCRLTTQHGVQILADVNVTLHDVLDRASREFRWLLCQLVHRPTPLTFAFLGFLCFRRGHLLFPEELCGSAFSNLLARAFSSNARSEGIIFSYYISKDHFGKRGSHRELVQILPREARAVEPQV